MTYRQDLSAVFDESTGQPVALLCQDMQTPADVGLMSAATASAVSAAIFPEVVTNNPAPDVAAANRAAIQAACDTFGMCSIQAHGIVWIDGPALLPDGCTVQLSAGVILKRINQPAGFVDSVSGQVATGNTGNIFRNRESWKNNQQGSGVQQSGIRIIGPGTIDGNAEALVGVSVGVTYGSGIHMDKVDRLFIGGGLRVRMCTKYQIYGSALTNSVIDGVDIYSDDTINPNSVASIGRDGIHIQGNTDTLTIRNIGGVANDDFIALNVRDVPGVGLTTARSIGPIRNVLIENITGRNQNRSGNRICLYGGRYTAAPGDLALPVITGIAVAGNVATVTTAAAHGMYPGQFFSLGASNPAGYDGAYLEVIDCPSPTTFRHVVAAGLAAWVGGTVFTKLYHSFENVTINGVRSYGNFGGSGVRINVTTDVANDGVIKGLTVNGLDTALANQAPAAATNAVFDAYNMRSFGLRLRDLKSRMRFNYPVIAVDNASAFLDGETCIEDIDFLQPFESSNTGVNPIGVTGAYRSLTIRGLRGTTFVTAGSQRQIIAAGAPGGQAADSSGGASSGARWCGRAPGAVRSGRCGDDHGSRLQDRRHGVRCRAWRHGRCGQCRP